MKIETKNNVLKLKEIYTNTVLETEKGNQLAVHMHDDTIEMCVPKFNKWYRVNMQTGEILPL